MMGMEALMGGAGAGGSAALMGANPWLTVGLAGLGAARDLMGANAQRKAERSNMLANAAAIQYSPWTGMNPGMVKSEAQNPYGAALGGAAQGTVSGLMFGQQFAKKKPALMQQADPLAAAQKQSGMDLADQHDRYGLLSVMG